MKIRALGVLVLGLQCCVFEDGYAMPSTATVDQDVEASREVVNRFGDELIQILDASSNSQSKIGSIIALIDRLHLIDWMDFMTRTCGKKHLPKLQLREPNFSELYKKYVVQIILNSVEAAISTKSLKYELSKKYVRKRDLLDFTIIITTQDSKKIQLLVQMDSRSQKMRNVTVKSVTSLMNVLKTQLLQVLNRQTKAKKQDGYSTFLAQMKKIVGEK